MKDDEISKYLDYWMDSDPFFSNMLGDEECVVEGVEHHSDRGFPRTSVSLNENLVLLFPPYQTGFDYSQIDYSRNN
jgi:hypothetical protein